jgi:hypothetical protein
MMVQRTKACLTKDIIKQVEATPIWAKCIAVFTISMAACGAMPATAQTPAEFYAGKTVTLVVARALAAATIHMRGISHGSSAITFLASRAS